MAARIDKIGVFVAGGPAAGINAVLKGIVQEADNSGVNVVGFLDGPHGLVHDRFVHLTRERVEDIPILGGSILGTSRYRVEADGMERVLANLRREGVDGLISIGGEGTLQFAEWLRRAGVRLVHVPKTIDNDIAGIDPSFGFDTAVHYAAQMLTAVKLDAESSDLWFVVEIMGRYTGHLALEAGLAAGCTRVLIPEEGPIRIPDLVSLVRTRARCGQSWGVILVAESARFGSEYITRRGRLGGVGEELADRLEQACREKRVECRIRTSNLGYFLRCAEPTGFDRSYAAKLGLGAGRFIMNRSRCGQMISVEGEHLKGIPLQQVAGVTREVDLKGISYQALQAIAAYESARIDLAAQRRARRDSSRALGWLDRNMDPETVARFAMRLGMPTERVLEVLADMVEVESGAAELSAGFLEPPPPPASGTG